MLFLLTAIHVLVCLFLIIVVLLQSGKAADLAGAFGAMGSQTASGPRGAATVLTKATTVAAVVFMATSLMLSIFATRSGGGSASTVLQNVSKPKVDPAKGGTPETKPSTGTGPSVTVAPEGADASQSVTIPLPTPESLKKEQEQQQKKK